MIAGIMKTSKTRHQFYLPDELSEKLEQLSSKSGASKTSVLTDALNAWLQRQAGHELDQRFGPRLDRLAREQGRIHDRLDLLAEALGLFIQHQMTLVAHQPAFDPDTARLGRDRYQRFVELVGRRLAQPDGPLRLAPRRPPDGK